MTSGRHYCDLTPAFQTVTCHDTALHSSCPSMALCSECFKYLGHFLFCHWSLLDHVSQDPGLPRKTTGIHRSVPIGILDPERSRNSPGIHGCLQKWRGSTKAPRADGDPRRPNRGSREALPPTSLLSEFRLDPSVLQAPPCWLRPHMSPTVTGAEGPSERPVLGPGLAPPSSTDGPPSNTPSLMSASKKSRAC